MKASLLSVSLLFSLSISAQVPSECLKIEEQLYIQALTNEDGQALEMENVDLESCSANSVEAGLRRFRLYAENAEWDEARKVIEELQVLEGLAKMERAEISYSLGTIGLHSGNFDQAVNYFKSAENLGKSKWFTQFDIAHCYLSSGELTTATRLFEEYTAQYPSNHAAFNCLGLCYEMGRSGAKAIAMYKRAFLLSEEKAPVYAYNAVMLLRAYGDFEEAASFGLDAIEKASPHENLWVYVTRSCHKIGAHREALEISERLVVQFPNSVEARFRLAYAHGELGHTDKALKYYFETLDIDPLQAGALDNIANHYQDLGHFELAHEYIDMAISINPKKRKYYKLKADIYEWQQEFEKHLNLIVWIDKNFAPISTWDLDMGYAYMIGKKYKEGIQWFKKYVQKFPNDSRGHNNLARCYDKTGRYSKAKHHYKEALRCDPENGFIYHNMASMYADLGLEDLACENLAIALEKEYNWVIDEKLIEMHDLHCPEVSLDRTILLFGYKGNMEEYKGQSFIQIREMDESLKEKIKLEPKLENEAPRAEKEPSISQIELFTVYPNPSQDKFFVTLNTEVQKLQTVSLKVFDSNSKLVLSQKIAVDQLAEIDLSSQPSGTYILLISDEFKVYFNERLVVQR